MKAVGFVLPSCLTRLFVLGACVMWCGNDAAAQISAVWANDGGDKEQEVTWEIGFKQNETSELERSRAPQRMMKHVFCLLLSFQNWRIR